MALAPINPTPPASPLQRERECLVHSGHKGLSKNMKWLPCHVADAVQDARAVTKHGGSSLCPRKDDMQINQSLRKMILDHNKYYEKGENEQWEEGRFEGRKWWPLGLGISAENWLMRSQPCKDLQGESVLGTGTKLKQCLLSLWVDNGRGERECLELVNC